MNNHHIENISNIIINGKIFNNEPMSKHTSFGIGGKTCYVLPKNELELSSLLSYCTKNEINIFFAGSGSNLLVSDQGYSGIVVSLKKTFKTLNIYRDGTIVSESGVMLGHLVKNAIKNNIKGLESLIGVPGTLGGALIMNAGAYGSEISKYFISAELMDMNGKVYSVYKSNIKFSYRSSTFPKDKILIRASFNCDLGDREKILFNKLVASSGRKKNQPLQYRSAGSIFKNPENAKPAGYLIEKVGLKGLKSGNAEISEKHANFIINKGSASSSDVIKLIQIAQKEVYSKYSVQLKLEVKLLGFNKDIIKSVSYG